MTVSLSSIIIHNVFYLAYKIVGVLLLNPYILCNENWYLELLMNHFSAELHSIFQCRCNLLFETVVYTWRVNTPCAPETYWLK